MLAKELVCVISLTCFALPRAGYLADVWHKVNDDIQERELRGHFVGYENSSGYPVPTYLSKPAFDGVTRRPAVIVVHHAVGIYNDEFLRKFTDDLADEGFVAVLPDFFHRVWDAETVPNGIGIPVEQMNIMGALGSLKDKEIMDDLQTVVAKLEKDAFVRSESIGILGFCMGGRIAWLAAVAPELQGKIKAAVPYHGGNVFKGLGDGAESPAERIRAGLQCPVLGHFGAVDKNPSPADMARLQELAGDKLKTMVYPGADHGFACKDSAKYVEDAAEKAWIETLRFLKDTLGEPVRDEQTVEL